MTFRSRVSASLNSQLLRFRNKKGNNF